MPMSRASSKNRPRSEMRSKPRGIPQLRSIRRSTCRCSTEALEEANDEARGAAQCTLVVTQRAGGVLTPVDQGSTDAAPLQHPMTSRRWSCGTAGRCWRTIGTSAGSRISYTSPLDGYPARRTRCSGWSGKAGDRAPERRVSVTSRSPPPDPPLWCGPRWAMHAGPAAASSPSGGRRAPRGPA
jgi:hypothetical protein